MCSELRNKEFGIIDLIKSGWQIFKNKFSPILIIALLIDFPLSIVVEVARLAGADLASTFRIEFQLGGLLALLSGIAVMVITEQDTLGKKITAWSALKKALTRWPSALAAGFLFGVLLLFRLLLIIPGIIFLVNTAFFLHAVGLRNQGWKAALDYSRNLVKGRFWKVFYTFLAVFMLVSFFPSIILGFLIGTFSALAGQGSDSEIYVNLAVSFFDSLAYYLYVVIGTVFFLNMDYRKSLEN
jgi:hypothetical protein